MTSTTSAAITLEQYAGIIVAVDEGHALEQVLEQERVPLESWESIDTDFKDRLSQRGELFSEYAAYVIEAEDTLKRSVAPLERDPAAYLAFVSQFAASEPGPLLDAHALNLADIGRLGRHWERQFSADEDLRKRSFEEAQKAQPPAAIEVAVAELRPYRWTASDAVADGDTRDEPPPRQEQNDDPLARTIDPSRLPSAYRATPRAVDPTPAIAAPPRAAPIIAVPPARRPLEPSPSMGMTVPAARTPATTPTPFRGHGPTPAPAASRLEPHPGLGSTAPVGAKSPLNRATPFPRRTVASTLEPSEAMGRTAPLREKPTGPATPFAGNRPAPPPTSLEPHADLGQTAPVAGPRAPLEPVADLRETASISDTPATDLPFAGEHAPPSRVPLEPHPDLGHTAPLQKKSVTRDAPKRDDNTAAQPRSLEPNPALGSTIAMPAKRRFLEPNPTLGGTIAMPAKRRPLEPNPTLGGTLAMPATKADDD